MLFMIGSLEIANDVLVVGAGDDGGESASRFAVGAACGWNDK